MTLFSGNYNRLCLKLHWLLATCYLYIRRYKANQNNPDKLVYSSEGISLPTSSMVLSLLSASACFSLVSWMNLADSL